MDETGAGMRRRLVVWPAIVLAALGFACDSSEAPDAAPPTTEAVDGPIYQTTATVLQEDDGAAELCLGTVMQSLPPQCGGPPIVNWDWELVSDEERAAGVVWGDYRLSGRYDGDRFEMIEVSTGGASPATSEASGREPAPSRRLPLARLREIADELSGERAAEELGYRWLWSDIDRAAHAVEIGVDVATRRARRVLARRYGKGVVRLHPQLELLSSG